MYNPKVYQYIPITQANIYFQIQKYILEYTIWNVLKHFRLYISKKHFQFDILDCIIQNVLIHSKLYTLKSIF